MNTFTFDNRSSADFGLIVADKDIYSAPTYDQQFVSVPGRNGDVIIDNGRYNNTDVSYTCYCKDLSANMKAVRQWLCRPGYFKLTDTYDPLYFRYAAFASKLKVDELLKNVGKAELVFNCRPFRYSVAGQTKQTLTASGTITNPESFPALPYIKITGSGAVTLTIGAKAYSFTSIPTYLEIDSELMCCYKGSTLYNNRIGFAEFPVLQPGNNSISWTGSVTKVEIIPNWRTL